jgi:maltose O-acetyltransferase
LGLDTLYVGNDVYFASNVFINGGGAITLEDQVMIGIGSVVVSGNHSLIDGSYRWGDRDVKPIEIGFGSWVGANCTVLAGAKIPCSTVIAANSAVKGVLMYSGIYAGLPAKRVR